MTDSAALITYLVGVLFSYLRCVALVNSMYFKKQEDFTKNGVVIEYDIFEGAIYIMMLFSWLSFVSFVIVAIIEDNKYFLQYKIKRPKKDQKWARTP